MAHYKLKVYIKCHKGDNYEHLNHTQHTNVTITINFVIIYHLVLDSDSVEVMDMSSV